MDAAQAGDSLYKIRDFLAAARSLDSLIDFRGLLSEVIPSFGVSYYLMTHHVDFGRPAPGTVQISNYPPEFVAVQREQGGWRDDPILLACEKTAAGFFWSDVGAIVPMTDHHHRRFEEGRRYGLSDGFVVPNHIPGEYSGSVHFTVDPSQDFPRQMSTALQSLATYAFEIARQLARDTDGTAVSFAPLTARQIECLLLSARGKSDTDIAQLLKLSPATVNEHIEAAKRRYCVATRQQAIILALFNSQFTFAEVLH
jgi:LuxR family quorum-sensing system transcriptional regulator CciR